MKKLLISLLTFSLIAPTFAAYEEVDCTLDPAYAQNSCSQCFRGDGKSEGDNLGFLSDEWVNDSGVSQILYKEEQAMPYMVNLAGDSVMWTQIPNGNDFWEWTPEFNALYNQDEEGYVLAAGQRVTWLKSQLGFAYQLEKNSAPTGANIGLMVYPFKAHTLMDDGQVSIEDIVHNECVLFTSGTAAVEKPTELPQTGPEHIILIAIALLLGFGLVRFTKKA